MDSTQDIHTANDGNKHVEMDSYKEELWIESDGNGIEPDPPTNNNSNNNNNNDDDDDDDDDDDIGMTDLFADPDPYDEFSFSFPLPSTSTSNPDNPSPHHQCNIHLFGIKEENGQTLHSTGLTIWRASPLLCQYMIQHPQLFHQKATLELGAGLGLCGILAHHLGAQPCILTDGDTETLQGLRRNVEYNIPSSSSSSTPSFHDTPPQDNSHSHRIPQCHQLRWGRKISSFQTLPHCAEFDVILGSDIIYVEEILTPLFQTVHTLLKFNSESQFLLSYARRNVNIDLVLECASRFGFDWRTPEEVEGVFVFFRHSQQKEEEEEGYNSN